ncbi:sodium-coupled monocarboxylate transporter 1 isoform X2 [Pangasianodon hypophthalmus]|uniref:sodium-coupled monocarboxylate transporter 1 isoform X2 n=1 Tax=Pangasianodon hypophthalmus TaxID=310915 RepID=UPI000F0073CB|nr:sodium-coupled monocarboxylate transporter 1 isoform X2 [Pangasianodon hypophthalmus]
MENPAAAFGIWDYVVFALMLVISAAIGVYYAVIQRRTQTPRDFLVGGQSMTAVPVALSLTASFMSAITVLATPVEVYCNGAIFVLSCLGFVLMVAISSEFFLPIFYRLEITSTYEYLELRFNKVVRLFGTVLFIVQTLVYTGVVIYAPALALNQVTGISLWGALISTGVVCTFYCTLGGFKAVVWTDVFQMIIMLAGFLAVIVQSVLLQGGVSVIFNNSADGGRLNLWDFDPNPLRRHTFWTIIIGSTFIWTSMYGINQAQVQRYVSCKTLLHAKLSLYINLVSLWAILLSSVFCGLCLYSFYKNCDPWTAKMVSAQDQLMPYLVMDILGDYPGIPGLFVAAAYSGTLSTVSSSVSALAAVTVADLIRPYFSLSEQKLSWASKGLSVFYGVVCIGLAALASLMGGLLQTTISIVGTIGGPLLGLFSLGILFPSANSKGGLAGLISGLVVSLWICVGAQVYHPLPENIRPLPLHTHGCSVTTDENDLMNWTSYSTQASYVTSAEQDKAVDRPLLADYWYSLSYMYFCPMGTLVCIVIGLIVSLFSGGRTLKLEPGLTLTKEDLTCYKIYKILKQKATGNADRLDLVMEKEKSGRTNLAFCDVELDITKIQAHKTLA